MCGLEWVVRKRSLRILKTGWATGPMPLQARDRRGEECGARQYLRQ
jgi:hypothetical protein